jgi:hypothetical protein
MTGSPPRSKWLTSDTTETAVVDKPEKADDDHGHGHHHH